MDGCDEEWRYMIIRPERASVGDLWRFWRHGNIESGSKFIIRNGYYDNHDHDHDQRRYTPLDLDEWKLMFDVKEIRWVILVSLILRKLVMLVAKPMEWFGHLLEFVLNLLALNGNIICLFFNILRGKVVIPQRGTTSFMSVIGHLDGRVDLCKDHNFGGSNESSIQIMCNRSIMDLCILASKLAYENACVVEEIVVKHWKMHLVGFYNCWNDHQESMSTQLFILCDKPVNASLILISFKGTETFNAKEWSINFDFSWFEIPGVGKLHIGFLEALGLVNRTNLSTFQHNIVQKNAELTAYFCLETNLRDLLEKHRNARFVVTGHSLGAALAILFPTMLILRKQSELMNRLLGVYTFGQPRIGDRDMGNFIEERINKPKARYFRFVYCNDIVPRLPCDDDAFLFKHFGVCLYYNSFYVEKKVKEEPNKNFYGIRYLILAYTNAIWELIRAFMIHYIYGANYKEGWFSICYRVIGLFLPGFSAHAPRDYINSVRLYMLSRRSLKNDLNII